MTVPVVVYLICLNSSNGL